MGKAQAQTSPSRRAMGRLLARLIRMVARTSSPVREPAGMLDDLAALHPCIVATWHGQFMMTCEMRPPGVRVAAMVARHGDAELIGEAMAALDVELIRGAGAGGRRKDRGGVHALRAAVAVLQGEDGKPPASVVMTADVPPGPARRAGEGIVQIARLSGRPIVPVATATSRYLALKTWSRMTVNLPFSRIAHVAGRPVYVAADADAEAIERARKAVEDELNAVTLRAYRLAGVDPARATPPNPASPPPDPGLLLKTYLSLMRSAEPLAGPLLDHRRRKGKEDPTRLAERRGEAGRARPEGPLVWVHATSVGEMNAVLPLIEALLQARGDLSVLLTTTTLTSASIAAARLPPRAFHQYVPLDVPGYAARFLDHWRPDLAVFTESEIWPSLILATAGRSIPLALVNARMSAKSYRRWRRLSGLAGPLIGRFSVILAQNEKLARWFRDTGGRQVLAAGNLKADAPPPPVDSAKRAALVAQIGGRPCLLAASTHEGEEAIVAAAHRRMAAALPGFLTLIAPRHPDRGEAIARDLTAAGFACARRALGEPVTAATNIYIADTIGELGTLYSAVPLAFIGGSLMAKGGQNPLEAVAHGAAVLTGPSVDNFKDEYGALLKAGGAVQVADGAGLAAAVERLASDAAARQNMTDRAADAVAGLKGALARTLATLLPLLPSPPSTPDAAPVGDISDSGLRRAS